MVHSRDEQYFILKKKLGCMYMRRFMNATSCKSGKTLKNVGVWECYQIMAGQAVTREKHLTLNPLRN